MYDTIIIGGGVTGFSAAMYAGRLELKTLVISKIRGGTIILTNEIGNWPGIKMTDGITLAKDIEEHALEYGVEVVDTEAIKVEKNRNHYVVHTNDGNKHETKTVIFATGTEWRKLNVPGENEFANRGVHYCALCDGYFYKDKVIAVVGGADSAVKEANLLTQWAKKVYIIYRGENVHPEPPNLRKMEKFVEEGKIEVITNTNAVEIKGDKFVTKVLLDKKYNGSKEFPIEGLFVDIGHIPQSQLAKELGVEVDKKGDIIVNKNSETNVPGVYAAGDVANGAFKQAITGSAEGVLAAFSAYEYINK